MRTAKEMYQYCKNKKYGEGFSEGWSLKHFSIIEKAIQEDETVEMCFIGLHNYKDAAHHGGNFAYAITNKRIIMAQKKVIGQAFQTISIANLNDITFNSGAFFGTITIDTIKETFNVALNKKCAQNINGEIHDILLKLKAEKNEKTIEKNTISNADEIMKYKKLLDEGIITQDEFERKKQQLLK